MGLVGAEGWAEGVEGLPEILILTEVGLNVAHIKIR